MAVAASGMLSVHESCPVCTPDPDVVLVHTPKPEPEGKVKEGKKPAEVFVN